MSSVSILHSVERTVDLYILPSNLLGEKSSLKLANVPSAALNSPPCISHNTINLVSGLPTQTFSVSTSDSNSIVDVALSVTGMNQCNTVYNIDYFSMNI